MAYQTGTVASPTALKTVIETFCTTNGFTLTSDWLSKGQSNINLATTLPGVISTITYASTLATVTMTLAHGLTTGASVTIKGATDSLYNGTFSITVIDTTKFSYTMTGTPSANATGFVKNAFAASNTTLTVSAANNADGVTGLCQFTNSIYIIAGDWPVTYYLFYSSTPDQVVCVLQYATNNIQTIMFGDIVKVHSLAYTGGNWFFATRGTLRVDYTQQLDIFSDTVYACLSGNSLGYEECSPGIPFTTSTDNTTYGTLNVRGIHAEIDGNVWPGTLTPGSALKVSLTDYTIMEYYRNPNTWNSQTQLVPIHLQYSMESSLEGYLGYIEHIRLVRVDNYEIGDIITLGSDKWKVFPWLKKDTVYRNGVNPQTLLTGASGTAGFAVRYDGP